MDSAANLIEHDFGTISALIQRHSEVSPNRIALCSTVNDQTVKSITYQELDRQMNRVVHALRRESVQAGECIAICAASCIEYAVVFLGALRAGIAVAPLPPNATNESLARMIVDADAQLIFIDSQCSAFDKLPKQIVCLAGDHATATTWHQWLSAEGADIAIADVVDKIVPEVIPEIIPTTPFNIIYSSGTTGEPKGIVQGHGMRWAHIKRSINYRYDQASVTLLSTPLYSNTTLVVFFPTLAFGGCVVLMPKFDALNYLQLAQSLSVTHTMLVPVQYQRLMAHLKFDSFDLSQFKMKFCTSAPFSAALKADVLQRWPGGLIEFYGMTEGGGTVVLEAHNYPDKLHTVGKPALGSDVRLIDDDGHELSTQAQRIGGEIVGHSAGMMTGYHGQPEKTREVEWFDETGKRFIRTGDIGRFDEDGFLILFDRKKDVIISGGYNIYPSDLEAVLRDHPAVQDVAVVAAPSVQWGETPVAFVVLMQGADEPIANMLDWANQRLGKTQRIASVVAIDELPRSAIGKVLKRELRELLARQR